jgi:hypothetical protein
MFGIVIVAAVIALLAGFLGTLIALKIQYRYLQRTQAQRTGWEHAQESGQRNWEIKQEKRALEWDAKLTARIQQVEHDWNAWKQKNAELAQTVAQQHAEIATFLHIERELARIPLVEEMPIAFDSKGQQLPTSSRWHPLSLARVDLSDRDLSRRYLGHANLHEARLRGANLFMADLSGADLSGADLTGADLTGANLSHADLHDAILLNANLQVADLHSTILFGANLRGARNLSHQQLDTAIYDATSQLDTAFDLTIPRLPRVNQNILTSTSSMSAPSTRSKLSARHTIPDMPVAKAKKQANEAAIIHDLDVSPTPVAKEADSSPASSINDEIIEGEITEISEAVTLETEAVSAPSEPTDAEIGEITDSETQETNDTEIPEITGSEIHETDQTEKMPAIGEIDETESIAISESESDGVSADTVSAVSAVSEAEVDSEPVLEHTEEADMPDIVPLPIAESFVPFVTESELPVSESESPVSESELFIAGSELPVSESEPTNEPSLDGAGSFEPDILAGAAVSEPEFVALEIEQSTNGNEHGNGNGHANGNGNRHTNGNGNGKKPDTLAGTTIQKGKNNTRRRTRNR